MENTVPPLLSCLDHDETRGWGGRVRVIRCGRWNADGGCTPGEKVDFLSLDLDTDGDTRPPLEKPPQTALLLSLLSLAVAGRQSCDIGSGG